MSNQAQLSKTLSDLKQNRRRENEPFSDSVLPLSNGVVRLVGSHVAVWLRYDSNNILRLPCTCVLPLNYTF